ncbi:hypothetical protein V2J09_012385 [Rumex salicifolius]
MEPNTPRAEAERWLGIAAKMLASRDLVGSRSFAIRGREADPTNPISEQIIAIVDTLIAAEKRVTNSGHHDWYSILQVSHLARDLDLIASQYRRLFLLLNPDHNHFPFADYALRVVADAWSVLSDPTKKWMYDSELSNFLQRSSAPPPDPEPVRVDSSAATYQFFHQPPQQQQQAQQQWMHHLHHSEQPQVQLQERQLFHQQHHQPPPPPQSQHQWLPQTQLQQLLPEQQRPSQPQWLPQSPQPHQHQPQQQPWMPDHQRSLPTPPKEPLVPPQLQQPPPPQPKEPQIPPQLQRPSPQPKEPQLQQHQPQQPKQKQQQKKTLPPPPPPPTPAPPVQTPPFLPPSQQPPQRPPQQPPQQSPQQPLERPPQDPPQEPPQDPVREKDVNEEGADNGNEENDCNESASKANDAQYDGGEQIGSFWTACPYCYYLYEYPKAFQDCTLRCQNCRRAFQAIPVPGPPGNDGNTSFCSWGFFPIGFSMTSWKKNTDNANGFGSNWMPFSPMFACPVQPEVKKKKVWEIVDEDEDEFDVSDSSDDPDSSDDWGSTRKKVKRGSGKSRRGRPRKKSNVETEKGSNGVVNGESVAERTVNHGANGTKNDAVNHKAVASGSLRKQTGKGVRGRKKLDLNVEFSNEVEDHAPVTREGNGEEVVEFFEGLDEFLSTLPILHSTHEFQEPGHWILVSAMRNLTFLSDVENFFT